MPASSSNCARSREVASLTGFCVLACCCLLCSCVRFEPKPLDAARNAEELESRSLTNLSLRSYTERVLKHDIAPWPPATWDLEMLSLAAYWYHPALEVVRAQWTASTAGEITAGQRPNPTLNVTPGYNATTATPSPWLLLGYLDFPIETAGKRKHRLSRAEHFSEAARLNIIAQAWQIRRDVRAALVDYFTAEQRVVLLTSQSAVQNELLAAFEAQLKAGVVGTAEMLPYRLAAAKTQVDLQAATRQKIDARARLAESIGVPIHALDGLDLGIHWSNAERSAVKTNASELRRAALLGRADVLSLLAEYEAADSALRLEIARQYPDIHLQPGYEYDQGDSKWTLGITLELPIMNQNQGPIAEADAHRKEIAARFNALQSTIMADIDRNLDLLKEDAAALSLLESVTRYQNQRQNSLQAQYQSGAIDRLELLAGQTESLATEISELEARARLEQSIGALENALQRPLDLPLPDTLLEGAAQNAQ